MVRLKNSSGPYAGTMKGLCVTQFDDHCMRNLYLPYLKYNKMCNNGDIKGKCWSDDHSLDGTEFTGEYTSVVLNNGMLMMFRWHNNLCDNIGTNITYPNCGWMSVDVNGFNPPNIWGKDIFGAIIVEKSIKPMGSQGDLYGCEGSTGVVSGLGCSAKYLYQ